MSKTSDKGTIVGDKVLKDDLTKGHELFLDESGFTALRGAINRSRVGNRTFISSSCSQPLEHSAHIPAFEPITIDKLSIPIILRRSSPMLLSLESRTVTNNLTNLTAP